MDCACSMGMGGMSWMMLGPALFLAALLVGGVVLVRHLWGRDAGSGRGSPTALDILEERYARGEIDGDEFRHRRDDLVT